MRERVSQYGFDAFVYAFVYDYNHANVYYDLAVTLLISQALTRTPAARNHVKHVTTSFGVSAGVRQRLSHHTK